MARRSQATRSVPRTITWLYSQGITVGVKSGGKLYYQPNAPVTRGAMAAFLCRMAGSPKWTPPKASPFADVKPSNQFYPAITWLYSQQVTTGVPSAGKLYYQPTNSVNRGAMSAFMQRLSNTGTYCSKYRTGVGC